MGGGKQASTPDYGAAAAQDAAGNKANLTQQTWANRPTINTPFGQQSWEAGSTIDPSTGQAVTSWTQNLNLTPDQQAALDSQQAIQQGRSGAAQQLLGQATDATSSPFDWSNLPPEQRQAAQAGNVQDAQQRAYQNMSQMLQPGRQQEQAGLDTKLANMGLSAGSTANQRANMQLANQWGAQDRAMMGDAMRQGTSDVQTQYGMDTSQVNQGSQLRQQAIAEEAQRRGMPLNELNALLTGQQVGMPQMPGFNAAGAGQPSENLAASQALGNMNMGNAQLQQQTMAGYGQLAGAGMGVAAAAMF